MLWDVHLRFAVPPTLTQSALEEALEPLDFDVLIGFGRPGMVGLAADIAAPTPEEACDLFKASVFSACPELEFVECANAPILVDSLS